VKIHKIVIACKNVIKSMMYKMKKKTK